MKVLFIDTHMFDINIILFEDDHILRQEQVIGKKQNSQYLLPTIDKVCQNDNIDEVVVINGPGSFTGVRLGVTVAKTYAYVKNIPIKAISYFDLLSYSVNDDNFILGIPENNGYYLAEYQNKKLLNDYFYLSNNDFNIYQQSHNVITDVAINYNDLLLNLPNISPVNPHIVKPLYIKHIEVENVKKSN